MINYNRFEVKISKCKKPLGKVNNDKSNSSM